MGTKEECLREPRSHSPTGPLPCPVEPPVEFSYSAQTSKAGGHYHHIGTPKAHCHLEHFLFKFCLLWGHLKTSWCTRIQVAFSFLRRSSVRLLSVHPPIWVNLCFWDGSRLCNFRSRWTTQAYRTLQLGHKNKDQISTSKWCPSDTGQPRWTLIFRLPLWAGRSVRTPLQTSEEIRYFSLAAPRMGIDRVSYSCANG